MSRSRQPAQHQMVLAEDQYEPGTPSKCARFLYYTWKFCTCVFSHIMLVSLVVSYCILGAFTFEHLEAENEKLVKSSISQIRGNYTEDIWKLTKTTWVLHKENWTEKVVHKLGDFEKAILTAMREKGWDGDENPDVIQWTFVGALFFSIIVITTIGYGHIAPKTHMGKVVTIFYAILGIPLMLLCLSNIGDIMATSFRFLYWRVCCYVCTRKPKKKRHRSTRGSARQSSGRSRARSSTRKPVRNSQRSGDSGFPALGSLPSYSYSDTECRYEEENLRFSRGRNRASQLSRFSDTGAPSGAQSGFRTEHSGSRGGARSGAKQGGSIPRNQRSYSQAPSKYVGSASPRAASLDRRHKRSASEARGNSAIDEKAAARTPMYFNKYAVDIPGYREPKGRNGRNIYDPDDIESGDELPTIRSKSLPRNKRPDFYIEDYSRSSPREQRRDRSPRDERRHPGKASKEDLDLPRSRVDLDRDIRMRSTGELKTSRDMRPKDYKYRHSLEVEDARNRYRNQLTPEDYDDRSERAPRNRKTRSRFERDSDEEYDASPYFEEEDEPDNYISETDLAQRAAKHKRRAKERERALAPSARIMSPMGIAVHRQAKYMDDFDIEYANDDEYYQHTKNQIKPVPIWLCVFLVVSYIIAGAFLFSKWEGWLFLDSAYFCFITLTTIGFGDFVPAQGVKANSEISIALCSLYLLFGISLLAMSFNLVQEEVIANVKSVAKRLGIIKPDLGDESDDD